MKIRKKFIVGFLLYFIIVIVLYTIPFSVSINKMLAIFTLILSVVWVYECANITCLMIMSIFVAYSNYSIVMGIYLDESLRPKYLYPQITDINVYGIGISILLLVMLSLTCLTPKYITDDFNIVAQLSRQKSKIFIMN